jgi:hypothetical protein
MAVLNTGVTGAQILSTVTARLFTLRAALEGIDEVQQWLAGVALADLTAAPLSMDPAVAQAVLDAMADANAFWTWYNNGGAGGRDPSTYNIGASQRRLIGPQ